MDTRIEPMQRTHWQAVKQIYAQGLATGLAAFMGAPPVWKDWDAAHLEVGRSVALREGDVVGWAALAPVADN